MTLNLWGYNGNWELRLSNILEIISKEKPDIIVMQEVRDDRRYNKKGQDQGKLLKTKTKYSYAKYFPVKKLLSEHKIPLTEEVYEGLLCLSKHPITKQNIKYLVQQHEDRHKRVIQQLTIKIGNKKIPIWNIHFSNRDDWSRLHLQETATLINKQPVILAGDFNIQIPAKEDLPKDINEIINKNHKNSYDFKRYISYKRGNVTLDYILIPKQYNFKKVTYSKKVVSDHTAIIATIEI